jgi:hypothetical protein
MIAIRIQKRNNEDQKDETVVSRLEPVKAKIEENLSYMRNISDTFPRPNTLYLKVILGSVCVSILNKAEK